MLETGVEADQACSWRGGAGARENEGVLGRFLQPHSTIADVGGGTGVYADWLVSEGHRVELVGPVPAHVERARARAGEPPRFGVHLADARDLPLADGPFDAVLLLGPLYHLGDRHERLLAIREAARVCRSGGVVLAAAISRYAGLFKLLRDGSVGSPSVVENVMDEVRGGRRVPPDRRMSAFPDAYFHLPDELRDELSDGGLHVEAVLGIGGPGVLLADLERWRDHAEFGERLLALERGFETDPRLMVVSAHLLGVGRKPWHGAS